jgi:hypothetical protein
MKSAPTLEQRLTHGFLSTVAVALVIAATGAGAGLPGDLSRRPRCQAASGHELYAPRGFFGYACRDDRCSSHMAGFDWAGRNGIVDARACTSRNDPAFAEGCRAFAEEAVTPEQAGFEWARENELDDRCLCAGAGPGFEAGCAAYVTGFAQ